MGSKEGLMESAAVSEGAGRMCREARRARALEIRETD